MTSKLGNRISNIWLWMRVAGLLLVGLAMFHLNVPIERDFFRFVITFDITQSMNVHDAGDPNDPKSRLAFAKQAALEALHRLPCGSEVGLAVFTQYRTFVLFTPIEVCQHFREISQIIDQIDWRMAWRARSEIAKGLYSATRIVHDIEEKPDLVFITDGHESPPVNPELRPKVNLELGNISGVIVGVGGFSPQPIPKLDSDGKITGYWKAAEVMQVDAYSYGRVTGSTVEPMAGIDNSDLESRIRAGQEHLSSLKESYLQQLAQESLFDYVRLENGDQLAQHLLHAKFARQKVISTDIHWMFGLLALMLLLAGYLTELPKATVLQRTLLPWGEPKPK